MTNQINATPYRDRQTWAGEMREVNGWKLKVYGICAAGCELQPAMIERAMRHAETHVLWPPDAHGCGFVILHHGEEAVWVLVDLWINDSIRHFLFRASLSDPEQFTSGPDDGTMACVWELAVMMHERRAWIDHVLSRPVDPDYDAYLSDTIKIDAD